MMTFINDSGDSINIAGNIAITKQAVSIFNAKIKGDYSVNFKVPNNSQNRKTLNYYGPQMLNQTAFTRQTFTLMRDGNEFKRGFIIIQEDDGKDLDCFFVSGNSNWLQSVQNLITELDYTGATNGTDYTVQWSFTEILTTSVGRTTGIVFPIVDWAFDYKKGNGYYLSSGSNNWTDISQDGTRPIFAFYPCFMASSLLTEVCQQSGLKIAGSILNDPLFKSLALTPVDGQIKRQVFKDVFLYGSSQTFSGGLGVAQKYTSVTARNNPDLWNATTLKYSSPIRGNIYITGEQVSGTTSSFFMIYVNGVTNGVQYALTIGIKNTIPAATRPGDQVELYLINSVTNPFTVRVNFTLSILEAVRFGDYVDPADFLPPIKSIDFIKFLVSYFGCSIYFEEASKTLTLNIIEKMKLENAEDWSDYFTSYNSDYLQDRAQNNYMKWLSDSTDSDVSKYNDTHTLRFADGNIEADCDFQNQRTLCEFPFAPSSAGRSLNGMYALNIPLIDLVDEGDPLPFTSVVSFSAPPDPSSTFFIGVNVGITANECLRITDSNNNTLGYYQCAATQTTTNVRIKYEYVATFTGYIYRQRLNYNTIQPRIIAVNPSTPNTAYSENPIYIIGSELTQAHYACFTKESINLAIDQWKANLAIDNPEGGNFVDNSVKEMYFTKITKMINNPIIKARFRLPEAVFQSFDFSQFIYLKTETLTGYFFVDSIVNYQGPETPTEVNLYML